MAYYYGDKYLGKTSAEALELLSRRNCKVIVYDYLTSTFTLEELASFFIEFETPSVINDLAKDALENMGYLGDRGRTVCYGVVEYRNDDRKSDRRYQQSNSAKYPAAKKTTTGKTPARKPANRRRRS